MAVRPEGRGDLTDQAVLWSVELGVPRVTTPLAYDRIVCLMRNGGILTALDLATGDTGEGGRLRGAIDEYFAPPVAADDKVLTISRGRQVAWLRAGADWEVLHTSDLGDECFATPALASDGSSCEPPTRYTVSQQTLARSALALIGTSQQHAVPWHAMAPEPRPETAPSQARR